MQVIWNYIKQLRNVPNVNFEDKRIKLNEQLSSLTREDTCIAFSGGVDSSLLLSLLCSEAMTHGTQVYAVTFDTILHPRNDIAVSRQVAAEMGAIHQVIPVNELEQPEIVNNSRERCYYCKKALFCELLGLAAKRGIRHVIEGTNYDDLSQYRPGIRAVEELGVISPLKEAQLNKEEIRHWAEQLGISVAQRPSAPCMATRLPYGTRIDPNLLELIEQAENYIRELGFGNVRVRVHDQIARLEVDQQQFNRMLEEQERIIKKLKELGFRYITLDLEGFRSGSMDE